MFWRERISAVGVDWFSSAIFHATTVSAPSAGRSTSRLRVASQVAQLLEQPDLRFLFDRLVRRAVLADPERVVRPDELHRQFHQRRQAHRRLHVVGEDEEGGADGDHAAVQRHPVGQRRHRQLGHADLEELAREVALPEDRGALEEPVGLVAVGQVGRRDDHVVDALRVLGEHLRGGVARRAVGRHRRPPSAS